MPTTVKRLSYAGKTVLIDPKGDDYEKYAGATLITPNRAELKEVVGSWKNESELTEKAQNLRRHLDLTAERDDERSAETILEITKPIA